MKSLLASAFITYMSAAPEDVRQEKLKSWMEITGAMSYFCKSLSVFILMLRYVWFLNVSQPVY